MQAALFYHPEGFDTSAPRLMGRHAAGEGFLKAYALAARCQEIHCVAATLPHYQDFTTRIARWGSTKSTRWTPLTRLDALRTAGAIHYPGPGLGTAAWSRRSLDPRGYSITGVTHTTASMTAMDSIGDLLIAPVESWDALICTSAAVRSSVQRLLGDWSEYLAARNGGTAACRAQLPVIPLGVDCDHYDAADATGERRNRVRHAMGIAADETVFLFFGRLSFHAKANPLPMYMALERAHLATGAKVTLILAGWYANDAIQQAFLDGARRLCPAVRVIEVDGRTPEARESIWAAADVFTSLVDNIQETFGLTPLEAMAAGLPAVVTDWDGYRDTVQHGVTGFLVPTLMAPPGTGPHLGLRHELGVDNYDQYIARSTMSVAVDIEAATQCYIDLIRNPALRAAMGSAGRRAARDTFDWKVVVRQYEDLWTELAQRRAHESEVAARTTGAPAMPLRGDPFRLFESYPSAIAHPSMRVTAVKGMDAASLRQLMQLKIVALVPEECLPLEKCEEILAVVGRSDAPLLGDIIRQLALPHAIAVRTLVWLTKTGFLRIQA